MKDTEQMQEIHKFRNVLDGGIDTVKDNLEAFLYEGGLLKGTQGITSQGITSQEVTSQGITSRGITSRGGDPLRGNIQKKISKKY